MIITVAYGKIVDMDAARRCQRCSGTGRERYAQREDGRRCSGTGIFPEGWTYRAADDLDLALGDRVECPPTPYSNGATVHATVVDLGTAQRARRPLKSIIDKLPREVTS